MHTAKYPLVAALALLALAYPLRAQTAPSPSQAPAPAEAPATPPPALHSAGEVTLLDAFNVSGDAIHGYVSSQSVTGTRIATNIADLPFSVSVVTHDFLKDFDAVSMNEQLAFVAGVSPSEVTGQVQLRGFAAPTTMVDGFRRINLLAVSDIDRIEIIKGPEASIYGAIQPGGAINYITFQPTLKPEEDLQFSGGSDSQYGVSAYSSGPLGTSGKVFYRLDLSNQFNKYSEQFASSHNAYGSAKILIKQNATTDITFGFSHTEVYEHPFSQVLTVTEKQTMPWAGNNITESQYYGMTTNGGLLNYNYAGPESYDHNRLSQGTIDLEHQFNKVWSMRLGVNAYTNPYNDQLIGSGAYYPYGTGNVTLTNGVVNQAFAPEIKDQPTADWKPQRGGGMQLDNTFDFDTGPVNNKLLITGDYSELTQKVVSLVPTLGTTTQSTDYYALYSPYAASGASYYTPASTWSPSILGYGWNTTMYNQNAAAYNGVTSDSYVADGDYGLFASDHASMFKNRLDLTFGGRYDEVRNQVKNYNFPSSGATASSLIVEPANYQAFDYNVNDWTYEMGALFAITKQLSLYADKSTAFNPQPQIDSVTGLALPNNTSLGYEVGIKASLLGNRLNLSANRFQITEHNVAQTETDPVSGLKDTILVGEQVAKGYEAEFNYQATDDLIFTGDWGYTHSVITNGLALTFLDGLPARRVPRNNIGFATHYSISRGRLAGLFFVASGKYYSKSLVNLGSGKSLVAGPASATSGSTISMYYVPGTNLTYTSGTDPHGAGEIKITSTPVINVPFPANGLLPYPALASGATVNYPVGANGAPLVLNNPAVPNVYVGEPTGVFVDDGREYNFNAPYAVFDLGTGFSWTKGRFTHELQVNIKNVGNRAYTYGSGASGAPFQIVGTYSLKF